MRFFKEIVLVNAMLVIVGLIFFNIYANSKGNAKPRGACCESTALTDQEVEEFKENALEKLIEKKEGFQKFLGDDYAKQRKLIVDGVENFVDSLLQSDVFAKCFKTKGEKSGFYWCFEDYCLQFLKKDCSDKMEVLSSEDFEKFVDDFDAVKVYKLVDQKQAVEFKKGEINFDADIQGSIHGEAQRAGGIGIYATDDLDATRCAYYCDYDLTPKGQKWQKEGRQGQIVTMAIKPKAEVVDLSYVKNLTSAVELENYAGILCEKQKSLDCAHRCGIECSTGFDFLDIFWRFLEDLKELGFDYFSYAPSERYAKVKEWMKNRYKKLKSEGASVPDEKELGIYLSFDCNLRKILISAVLESPSLVAKFLGYDVIRYDELSAKNKNDENKDFASTYVVINPDVAVVKE